MDINTICLSGKLVNIGVHETEGLYPVVEANLIVNHGTKNDRTMTSKFNVRSYGKKSLFIANLAEETNVTIAGRLIEDKYFERSKTYINIDKLKIIK